MDDGELESQGLHVLFVSGREGLEEQSPYRRFPSSPAPEPDSVGVLATRSRLCENLLKYRSEELMNPLSGCICRI